MLKKSLPFLVAIVLLSLFSCSDDSKSEPEPGPGKTVTTEGGSLESPDKNIAVEIPAGAVSEAVNIEVKESTNDLSNGVGKIYSFTSQEFLKPVTLTLKYADADVASQGSFPELLRLMTRHSSEDPWKPVDGFTIDKEAKVLKVEVDHFSDWTIVAIEGTLNFTVDGVEHENLTLLVSRSSKNPNPASFRAQNDEYFFRAAVDSTVMGSNYPTLSSHIGKIANSDGSSGDTTDVVLVEPKVNNCYYRMDGSSRLRFTSFSTTPGQLVTGYFTLTAAPPNDTDACTSKKSVTGTFAYKVK